MVQRIYKDINVAGDIFRRATPANGEDLRATLNNLALKDKGGREGCFLLRRCFHNLMSINLQVQLIQ